MHRVLESLRDARESSIYVSCVILCSDVELRISRERFSTKTVEMQKISISIQVPLLILSFSSTSIVFAYRSRADVTGATNAITAGTERFQKRIVSPEGPLVVDVRGNVGCHKSHACRCLRELESSKLGREQLKIRLRHYPFAF